MWDETTGSESTFPTVGGRVACRAKRTYASAMCPTIVTTMSKKSRSTLRSVGNMIRPHNAATGASRGADDLVDLLAHLGAISLDVSDRDMAQAVCDVAVAATGVAECVVSRFPPGGPAGIVAECGLGDSGSVGVVEEFLCGEGSATEASRSGELGRWVSRASGGGDEHAGVLGRLGLVSEHAAMLWDGGQDPWVLTLLVRDPREESVGVLARADAVVGVAATLMAQRERFVAACTLATHLQNALDSRIVIEQAKGIIASRTGVAVEAAFSELRAMSRSQRRPVRQVAADVVAEMATVRSLGPPLGLSVDAESRAALRPDR